MRFTARLIVFFLPVLLVPALALVKSAAAQDDLGLCVSRCNADCNELSAGEDRQSCRIACFAGRCGHPGALETAGMSDEGGLDCELDSVCNTFCAEGPTPDPDCAPVAIEHDQWPAMELTVTVTRPDSSSEEVLLTGPVEMYVFFETMTDGSAFDNDSDGQDDVDLQVTLMELAGTGSAGSVALRLNPAVTTTGTIEETVNNTAGTLDVNPFTASGIAVMSVDLFIELEIDGRVLHTNSATHLRGNITHKPMDCDESLVSSETIELLNAGGNPSGYLIGPFELVQPCGT